MSLIVPLEPRHHHTHVTAEDNMDWKRFVSFERMITPVIIKAIFWIGLIASAIGGVILFFGGIIGGISQGEAGMVFGGLLGGPLVFVLGVLMARVYAELLILAFRINETLTDIKIILKEGQENKPAE
jgi:high-affinity Fe2+/Pb2+ permease